MTDILSKFTTNVLRISVDYIFRICIKYILKHINILRNDSKFIERTLLKIVKKSNILDKEENTIENSSKFQNENSIIRTKNFKQKSKFIDNREDSNTEDKQFTQCHGGAHGKSGSPHNKNKVPLSLFRKVKGDTSSQLFINCKHCRDRIAKVIRENRKEEKENKNKDILEEDKEEKFQACPHWRHKNSGSPHPKSKVPINLFRKMPNDKYSDLFKSCEHCRAGNAKSTSYHKKKKLEKEIKKDVDKGNICSQCEKANSLTGKKSLETICKNCTKENVKKEKEKRCKDIEELDESAEFRKCDSEIHEGASKSLYSKNKVPIFLFRKTPDNNNSKLFDHCLDCRQYYRNSNKKKNATREEKIELSNKNASETGFLYCGCDKHGSRSTFPRDEVPIEMFINTNYPDDPLLLDCSDCRGKQCEISNKRKNKIKVKAYKNGNFFCSSCNKEKLLTENAPHLDGTQSATCKSCKINKKKEGIALRENYRDVKYQIMIRNGSSCEECNRIFLYSNSKLIKLDTKLRKSSRYVVYEEVKYLTLDFIVNHKELLEMDVLEMDHLSEQEQRERSILKENDEYIPKKKPVSVLSSRKAMNKEAKKCQLLCSECHVKASIKREKGVTDDKLSIIRKQKRDYVNKIKQKGCIICGYINLDLLRYLDLDHINPESKIKSLSQMVIKDNYTLEEVKEECLKCRVLCRMCHTLHTREQIKQGLISFVRKVTFSKGDEEQSEDSEFDNYS